MNKYDYPRVNAVGQITNDSATLDLVPAVGADLYLFAERIVFSVYEASEGGGGICEVKDTDGDVIYTISVDGIKDITLDFGEEGIEVGKGVGLQAVLSGGVVKQASVSIAYRGHSSFQN